MEQGSKTRVCPTCGGHGVVLTSRGFISLRQTCPHCKGSGRLLEKPCKTCHGEGRHEHNSEIKLRIPAGVDTGSRLRSSGNGEAGFRGGPAGDLYIILHVKPHELFQRDGDDLLCEAPVSFVQAALGAEIEVPTLDSKVTIKIPAGTQTGRRLPGQRQRRKEPARLRLRRFACAHSGSSAHASECGTKGKTAGICRPGRRGR